MNYIFCILKTRGGECCLQLQAGAPLFPRLLGDKHLKVQTASYVIIWIPNTTS